MNWAEKATSDHLSPNHTVPEQARTETKDTGWKGLAARVAFAAAASAAFWLAYLAPDYGTGWQSLAYATQKGASQQNLDTFKENGWDTYVTGPDALSLRRKNPGFGTSNAGLKKAWQENTANIRSLFPGVEQVIENYLDGNNKNDEVAGISVGEDDYVILRVKSASKRVGFDRQNTTYYIVGRQFSKEAAEIIRSISAKYE
jgi:hypothetical protein